MRMTSFFDEMKAKNIVVFLENGKVKIDAEERFLTDSFLQELKSSKKEITNYLTEKERLDRSDVRQTLNNFIAKGCYFQFVPDGSTVDYQSDLLSEAENNWLIENHQVVMAILFQGWLMRNVFKNDDSLLKDFKFAVNEQIAILEDSNTQSTYLDAVIQTSWQWWLKFQSKELLV